MTTATRSCSSCGAELPTSARFCRVCGARQDAETREDANQEAATSEERRPTIAARSRFPIARVLLVLVVVGGFLYIEISGRGSRSPQTIEQRIESATGDSVTDCESSATAVNFRCEGRGGPHCYLLTTRDGGLIDLDEEFDLRTRQDEGQEIDYSDFGIEDQGEPVPVGTVGHTQDLCPGF